MSDLTCPRCGLEFSEYEEHQAKLRRLEKEHPEKIARAQLEVRKRNKVLAITLIGLFYTATQALWLGLDIWPAASAILAWFFLAIAAMASGPFLLDVAKDEMVRKMEAGKL